eukprot:10084527-Ditylum_brightwellii.AAC.1
MKYGRSSLTTMLVMHLRESVPVPSGLISGLLPGASGQTLFSIVNQTDAYSSWILFGTMFRLNSNKYCHTVRRLLSPCKARALAAEMTQWVVEAVRVEIMLMFRHISGVAICPNLR